MSLCILLSSESVDKLRLSVWSNMRLGVLNGMSGMTGCRDYCMLFEYFNQTILLNKLKRVWHFNFDLVHCVMFNEQVHEKH